MTATAREHVPLSGEIERGALDVADRLCVEVLGPIRVLDGDGRDITPDGALQRRLLALLVLRRGHVVSADAAIDALWGEHPPREPVAALQNHVSRLRRGLPVDAITSSASGYGLAPSAVDVDADRLHAAVHGDDLDPAGLAAIDEILQRWNGPAYPELDGVDDGLVESMRLDELRVQAAERRAEWRLASGVSDGLVAELAALAAHDPLRERPRALLMTALAQSGRAVEALRVYDDFRRLLGDELGIEPSPTLAAQHADLLVGSGAAAWAPASRVPRPVTSLIGRDALLADVVAMAERHRLVTLLGPGGVGKTRLLVEVGLHLGAVDPGGLVVMCELAAATEGSAIDTVAAALRIDGRQGVTMADRIIGVVGDAAIVLLLDNCEHVVDEVAAFVGSILAGCPNVRVVTTSRERLRLPAEHLCLVPPLACDADDAPAVQLFVERARAAAPAFDPDPVQLTIVEEIVARLDGLPLAIELAAARLHTHDVAEVAAGLDRPLSLLSTGLRTSARHSSLTAVVAWSFGLLDDELRDVFSALSVFSGPFSPLDAAAVCDLEPSAAAEAVAQLVERSLVVRAPGHRFALLETLRAFGMDQLTTAGRLGLVRQRHAERMLGWVEDANGRLAESGQPVLAEIDAAIAELRAALGWLLDSEDVERAGRLVEALIEYGFLRLRPDVLGWADRVIAADPGHRCSTASSLLAAAGYAAWMAGDVAEMGARAHRAIEIAERDGGGPSQLAATIRGNVDLFEGRLEAAADWYHRAVEAADDLTERLIAAGAEVLALGYAKDERAIDLADALLHEVGDTQTAPAAYVWYCAGEAALSFDLDQARHRLSRAVELAELTEASFVRGVAGASRASIEARTGAPETAAADYRWLIPHWQRAGMWPTQWTMLRSIVGLLERLRRHRDAAVLEGAVRATAAGHRIFGADERALHEIGTRLRTALGDDAYELARREGARLDGEAAAEHALRSL
jgi:predicted ATPase/DNA-binding SARP family transcriptional activator